jgi:hypothetical protein
VLACRPVAGHPGGQADSACGASASQAKGQPPYDSNTGVRSAGGCGIVSSAHDKRVQAAGGTQKYLKFCRDVRDVGGIGKSEGRQPDRPFCEPLRCHSHVDLRGRNAQATGMRSRWERRGTPH